MSPGDIVMVRAWRGKTLGMIVKVRGEEYFDVFYGCEVRLVHVDWLEPT